MLQLLLHAQQWRGQWTAGCSHTRCSRCSCRPSHSAHQLCTWRHHQLLHTRSHPVRRARLRQVREASDTLVLLVAPIPHRSIKRMLRQHAHMLHVHHKSHVAQVVCASWPAGASVNWSAPARCCTPGAPQPKAGAGAHEALQAADGYKAGASKAQLAAGRARSRLCKASLMSQALGVKEAMAASADAGSAGQAGWQLALPPEAHGDVVGPGLGSGDAGSLHESGSTTRGAGDACSYRRLKVELGPDYVRAWEILRAHTPFNLWIAKDPQLEDFRAGTL